MGEKMNAYRILVAESEVTRKNKTYIILIGILKRYDGMVWTGLIWIRVWTSGGLL
jgi:hypothetical protein